MLFFRGLLNILFLLHYILKQFCPLTTSCMREDPRRHYKDKVCLSEWNLAHIQHQKISIEALFGDGKKIKHSAGDK